MKNLYLQLGIDQNASSDDIKTALEAKPELRHASSVLLNESRRATYNRAASTLRSIGMLRHRLGLDANQTWFVETCPDFAPRLQMRKYVPPSPPEADSPAAETIASASTKPQIPAADKRNYKPWITAAVIIFATAVVLALTRVFL